MPNGKKVLVVMGVSGTGKTTVGKLLAKKLKYPFFDGDDFHPKENIEKMKAGQPLTDEDRKEWLLRLNQVAREHRHTGAIICCSALRKNYRSLLRAGVGTCMEFIYLNGSFELIKSRLEARKDHFMPIELLKSQFETLEPPTRAISVSISKKPNQIIEEIVGQIK
ncbi:gluconokinase [Muricauda sp. MAR_2010_75]|uniref:gluconokinase n=1 Tax=Allomuricauda sp. MAR_2010_75 TaxID=1250232 RepID=UPI0005684386|nr:gluconokinase [Muricauda sp. MAR_2010_75]